MALVHEDTIGVAASVLPSWIQGIGVGVVILAAASVLASNGLVKNRTHKNEVPLPPGPPAKWIWESDPIPKQNVLRGLAALVEQYGSVVSIRHGSNVTIVIGRMDAANEIMEKQGSVLVDRPRMIAAAELLANGMSLLLAPYGDQFRRLRRAAHTHLQPKAAEAYQEIQSSAAKDVILDILNDPKQFMQHVRRYASAVILRITYGKTSPTSNNDPEVVRMRQVLKNFQIALRPGAYLVERIPLLKYLPGYGRQLKAARHYTLSLFRDQMNRVREDMNTGRAGPSFGKTLLEHIDEHQLSEDQMAFLAGGLFGAGSDTTASGITAMILAAACYPNEQARVQKELDEVVGRDRIPTFSDRDILPQLQAFILEVLRWRPVTPMGFKHRAVKDIIWRGQCIPSGATVLGCHWAISRDPEVFPDPDTFNPGRWITEDGHVRTDLHFYTYGFGRRACPGQHIANRSLYINVAMLLWSFRIQQRPDAPINPDLMGFEDPIVFRPEPFDVDFIPRMEGTQLREIMA